MRAINHGGETHKVSAQVYVLEGQTYGETGWKNKFKKNYLQPVNQVLKDGYDGLFPPFFKLVGRLKRTRQQ